MSIQRNPTDVLEITGIPLTHMDAFQSVANKQRCVIMSRAVGTSCTQLIEEGYSSKGFHVKAKSCNWGPMAGFVLEDPHLTKRGPDEFGKQKSDLQHAISDWNATSTPLYISKARCSKLLGEGAIVRKAGDATAMIVTGTQREDQDDPNSRALRRYFFRLLYTKGADLKNAPSPEMYAVKYVEPVNAVHVDGDGGDHVLAMVNPDGLGGRTDGVRAALTGDYDLFSLAIHRDLYRPGTIEDRGTDSRMVSVPDLMSNIKSDKQDVGEDVHLGNMTGRLHMLREALNTAIRGAGYEGGNMVHHSDEAGRPFVSDVDLPVFAVAPAEAKPFALSSLGDVREFFFEYTREGPYVPMFNPGWMSELVFNRQGFNVSELSEAKNRLKPSQR